MGHPKRKLVFQPSTFGCYVSFREGIFIRILWSIAPKQFYSDLGQIPSGQLDALGKTQIILGWHRPRKSFQSFSVQLPYLDLLDMGVSKNRGAPQIIHFNRVFPYKPSILGYHHFWKHPYVKCLPFGSCSFCDFRQIFFTHKRKIQVWYT